MWVLNGGPWSLDNAMLVVSAIFSGVEPLSVLLWHLNFWIQIHDLPTGFMSEFIGKQLRIFFGEFLEYDPKNNSNIWRECTRIKIRLDVRKPLKCRKRSPERMVQSPLSTVSTRDLGSSVSLMGSSLIQRDSMGGLLIKGMRIQCRNGEYGYEHLRVEWPDLRRASGFKMRMILTGNQGLG